MTYPILLKKKYVPVPVFKTSENKSRIYPPGTWALINIIFNLVVEQ